MRLNIFLPLTAAAAALAGSLAVHSLSSAGQNPPAQASVPQAPHPDTPGPQSPCMRPDGLLDIACTLPNGAHPDPDVVRVFKQVDNTFASSLARLNSNPPRDEYGRVVLLGRLELYDKNLSVNRNIACVTCHMPETGFTSAVSLWNQTIVANPGSVPITNATGRMPNYRISGTKPYPYVYSPFSPIFHYNRTQNQFYGGNFWDMRATGFDTSNPAATQAEKPFLDAEEQAFPDPACVVYRISRGPYSAFFKQVWGAQSFVINWPPDVETVCSTPLSTENPSHTALKLSPVDRGTAMSSYRNAAIAIAVNEASPEVSPFTSKFDLWLAGKARLTAEEQRGFDLFNGKAKCNNCHLSGVANGTANVGPPGGRQLPAMSSQAPLFTDFAAHNIGVPRNLALPWFYEDRPDQFGYVPNPKGLNAVSRGVGDFLRGPKNPHSAWGQLAGQFDGKFQTPTLRDADKRPYPGFVKAYFHNGYVKSLKMVVHFYNTSQALPTCPQGSPGEGVTCWPPPAVKANLNTDDVGNLHLTDQEENDIVAFLKTLTDEYYYELK